MLTIAIIWIASSLVCAAAFSLIARRTLTMDEIEGLYEQAQGIKMFVDRDGRLVKMDEHEYRISE